MPRRIAVPVALCALAVSPGLAVAGASAAATPHATAAANCPKKIILPGGKGGYAYLATTKGVGCNTAFKVELSFQACRLKSGLSGRCHAKQSGLTCKEQRQSSGTTLIGIVSCASGKKSVHYTYLQQL